MHPSAVESVVGLAAICLLSGSAAAWLWVVSHWRRGEELLDYEPRLPAPWSSSDDLPPATFAPSKRLSAWGLGRHAWQTIAAWRPSHAIILLLAYLLLQVGAGRVVLQWYHSDDHPHAVAAGEPSAELPEAKEPGESDSASRFNPQEMRALLATSAIVNVVFAMLVVVVLHFGRARASWADLGLPLTRLGYDLRVGLFAFVATSVPVYLLQGLLGIFVEGEHPLVKFVRETNDLGSLVVAAVTAVLVAPLVEELLFRVLLQGWLESAWPRVAPRLPAAATDETQPIQLSQAAPQTPIAWQPIVVSSAVFALLHAGHGPDPIPLFVLALVLGYLYQRTHRIWASVTLHFSLNLCSLLVLWARISTGPAI